MLSRVISLEVMWHCFSTTFYSLKWSQNPAKFKLVVGGKTLPPDEEWQSSRRINGTGNIAVAIFGKLSYYTLLLF